MHRILCSLVASLIAAFFVAAAPGLATGRVQLVISNGNVWLVANEATAAEILAEWTRVGHTRIVNSERVAGGPLSLRLTEVPEHKALEIVLRAASGFVAVARTGAMPGESPNLSGFERILILPTSTAPARLANAPTPIPEPPPAAPALNLPPPMPAVQRLLSPDGQPLADDQDGALPSAPPNVPGFVPLPPGFAQPPR